MKIISTLILALFATTLFSQEVNFLVEIVHFELTGCDDGFLDDEEPTWKVWGRDNINTAFVGGTCYQHDDEFPFIYSAGNASLIGQNSTLASSIDIRLEAWEDDNFFAADRCTFDSGDDCHIDNIFTSINFRNDPSCQWNDYDLSFVDFGVRVRIKWEYSNFTAGFDIIDCGTSVNLSSEGSGSWTVHSGTNGSFIDNLDPTTMFSGNLGSYTLLWNSQQDCETQHTTDTVQVDFIATPIPNLTASTLNICEGNPVDFTAENGSLYDWSLNTTGNVVLSDGSGTYSLIPSINDDVVYVSVSNGTCSELDSINFAVASSPTPSVSESGGVLSTQTYPVYLWYVNGSPIPGATSIDYTPTQGGTYYVEVVGSNGCFGQSAPYSFSSVGIAELINDISIFPNPTNGIVQIQTELPIDFVNVFNSIGKKQRVILNDNSLDLTHLSNGVYIASISINNHIITKRIILSK